MGLFICIHRRLDLGDPVPAHHPGFPSLLLSPTLQVAGATASLFILIIIIKVGELFQDLPKVSPIPTPTQTGLRALARPGAQIVPSGHR